MLFEQRHLDGIADGTVTVAVRRWKRRAARAGGRHRIPNGVIEIDAVEEVRESQVTRADALAAGYASRDDLLREVTAREGTLYRIRFHYGGVDERARLRDDDTISDSELSDLRRRLAGYDDRSRHGRWTMAVLRLIADQPAVRAADLAALTKRETKPFKADVRKLKELGLTESLEVGYRLSPRGRAFLQRADTSSRRRATRPKG